MVRQHLLDFLFQKAAKAALGELSIQYWPSQIDKVIQLNSTLQVRHGVMLVGPAGGGKTTTRQILKRALVVLPSIQAREQLEMKGTGDYPEETGSSKTAQSHAVWEFARFIFVMGQFYRLYPAVTVKRNFFPYNVDILLSGEWMRCRSRWAVWFDDSFNFFLYLDDARKSVLFKLVHAVVLSLCSSQRAAKARRGSVYVSTLNPKCVTVGELYGEVNSTTMEWKDGLLSHIYRKYAKNSRGVLQGTRRKQSSTPPANAFRLSRNSSAKSAVTSVSAISGEENSEGESLLYHGQSEGRKIPQRANENSTSWSALKCMSDQVPLIGWKNGGNFLGQSGSEVKQYQSSLRLFLTLNWKLLCKNHIWILFLLRLAHNSDSSTLHS